MRAGLAVAAVVAAACGGASTPARTAHPPATAVELVTLLEAHADRVCACPDHACTERLDDEIAAAIATSPPPTDLTTFPRAEAAIQRAVSCAWTHETVALGFGAIPRRVIRSVRDDTCACTALDCVIHVQTQTEPLLVHLGAIPASREIRDEMRALRDEMTGCADALIEETPFIRDVRAFRDRACACAFGDLACAEAVQADLQAWGKTATYGPLTPREAARSKAIAHELGTCIGNAAEQPPP